MTEIASAEIAAMTAMTDDVHGDHTHDTTDATTSHDHAAMTEIPLGEAIPEISISATNDYLGGVNVAVNISGFDIVETDSTNVVSGEGHLHIYLDGVKVARFYDLSYSLENVDVGQHTIEVSLNAHDHSAYAVNGEAISASTSIVVAEPFSVAALGVEAEAITAGNIIISGAEAGSLAGTSIASAGDVNGDGIEDMIVGAPGVDNSAGAAYVVFGSTDSLSSVIDLSSLTATEGLTLVGASGEQAGVSVSSAGDINNDGFSDLLIGASNADPSARADAGAAYVVFGGDSLLGSITLSGLDGSDGFRLDGAAAGDLAGSSVAGIGDFNDDDFDDVLIGASGADPDGRTDAGSAYVVFGGSSFAASVELSSLSGTSGFRLDGAAEGDEFGFSVAPAGNFNGDEYGDLIVGAPGADPSGESEAGSAYVIFGASTFTSTDVSALTGTDGFRLDGVDEDDRAGFAVAGNGDANGDGFDDVIIGSPRAEVDGVSVGAAYLILGTSSEFDASVLLGSLDGSDGFRLAGDYASDPLLSSFIVNTTGLTAYGVDGQNEDLVEDALVNFTSVVPDANSVYATSSGISYQVIGPFPGNPGTVTDQDRTHVIPREPVEETGDKDSTSLGSTGVWIDGVSVYNWSDGMSYDNGGVWNQNAVYWEGGGLDANGGHPPQTGEYHTHTVNVGLMNDLGDDGSGHSPILGWSYDGFPIYGPWGYSNPDGTGDIVKLDSSWQERDITERTHLGDGTDVADGPTVAEVPLGAYVEDYEYVEGLGDLDEYNGIFSITPEYPDGIYHYVVTIDDTETVSVGSGVFPYVIGLEYYGVVEDANLTAGGGGPPDGGGGPPDGGGGPPDGGGGPPDDGGGEATVIEADPGEIDVAIIGDVNGDGIDDIAVGDPDAYVPGVGVGGTVDVINGGGDFPADTDLSDLPDDAIEFQGQNSGDSVGYAVGGVDLNGDGAADLLVGSPGSDSSTGSVSIVMGMITANNDAAIVINVTDGSTIVSESGTTDTVNVVLASQPTADVTIGIAIGDSDEVSADVSSLTFTTDNWNMAQTVTFTGIPDGEVDQDQSVTVTFDASSSDTDYNALANGMVFVTNQNVDVSTTPSIILTESNGSTLVSESGETDTIDVTLGSQPTADVTIAVNSSNTNEVTAAPNSLVFTSANWDVAQTVTVTGVADGAVDADQTVNIVFDPVSTDTNYNALVNSVVFAGNENIDVANVAPVADAGGPYAGTIGDSISIIASGSSDADGTITSYAWDLDNDGQYDDASGATATYAATAAGTFTVGLQVTDNDSAISTTTASITVSEVVVTDTDNWTRTPVGDEADAFFDDSYVHDLYITFDDPDWYDTLFESHSNDADDPYFSADFSADGVSIDNVGVRFKGNSSFDGSDLKKSLKIDFDEFDEENDDLTFFGLKKLNLNNNFNDPTQLREKLFLDYASNFAEGVSRAVHTNVYINGELWGLYTAVEQIDQTFVETRFGSDEDGNLFKGSASDDVADDPSADFGSDLTYLGTDPDQYDDFYQLKTNETAYDYSQLIEFIDVLNNTPSADLADAIEPLLDVQDTLAGLAINNLFANLDSYTGAAHNYYLYDRDDTGQFTHILWDANESFGTFAQFTERGQDIAELDPFWIPVAMGPPGQVDAEERPLMESLWAVDEYSEDYLRDLAEMLRGGFDVTTASVRINELADLIRDDVNAEPNGQYTPAQFETNLDDDVADGQRTILGLTSFISDRADYLNAELQAFATQSDLRLNELMSANVSTAQDEAGDFDPWVEILNYGTGTIDLSGLYLTDDAGDLTQWALPSESLDDGAFETVWLDGETGEGSNHASFTLSATGGELHLTDGSTIIDSVTYEALADDASLARIPDGNGDFLVTDQPTLGESNLASVVVVEPIELYINEFMADNDTTIEDPDDAGSFEDWIELYNPGTEAIDLGGLYLTDDLTDSTQWQFTDGTTIAAGGYLIVWADGDTDQGDTHASFKLSSDGEAIGLYNIDGTTMIDSVQFDAQATDISYGRFPDGSDTFVSMTSPTPGATNFLDAATNLAPTADAGGPYAGLDNETISLSAADSSDLDGTISSYAWDLDNDGQYDDATGSTVDFSATALGTFTIGVQVTDDDGATSVDTTMVTVLALPAMPSLYINEFLADNDTTIEDPDEAGSFEDWIEIYNPGTEAIDLSGLYLTDDLADSTQWQFTDGTTIDAGGYLIILADGDTDQGGTHASFKLSTGGETIGLFDTDGTTLIDSVQYDAQVTDISYGRFPDGSDTFVSMTSPTPGAANVNDTTTNLAPTADAAGPYNVLVNETISLSAAGSSDPDGTISSYAWDLDNDGEYDDATGSSADFSATAVGTFTVGVQVTDDDGMTNIDMTTVTVSDAPAAAGLVIVETGGSTSVDENGTSDVISVTLASQPTADVTIAISSSDQGEVSLSTSQLTFTPTNWDVAQAFTATGVADGLVDDDQTSTITIDPSSSDANYETLASSNVTATNQNIDSNPELNATIITPDFVIRPHVILSNTVPTAVLFVAHESGTLSVTPVATGSAIQTIRVLDGNVQEVSTLVDGVVQTAVTAGAMYAIVFQPDTIDRIYSVSSTAGTDAFTQTVTRNFLQPTDTNGDSQTSALDALVIINQIARVSAAEGESTPNMAFYDVNGDESVDALDALFVVNELMDRQNAQSQATGEGEFPEPVLASSTLENSGGADDVEYSYQTTIQEESESINAWNSDANEYEKTTEINLVDDVIRDAFGTNGSGTSSDSVQLLSDEALDLSWV